MSVASSLRLHALPQVLSNGFRSSVLLAFWGFAVCLHYAPLGFMPLDQSIFFDGAWRLLSGQIPFRDFTLPFGIVPVLMQSAVSAVLGMNWFSLCVHSALINGIFCVLVFQILKEIRLPHLYAFTYAFLSGLLLYPPGGTPRADTHAFFFLALLLYVLLKAENSAGRRAAVCYSFVFPVFFLAFFSKQNPACFGIVLIVLHFAKILFKGRGRMLPVLPLTAGLVFCSLALFLTFRLLKLDFELIELYFIRLPSAAAYEQWRSFIENPQWFQNIERDFSLFQTYGLVKGAAAVLFIFLMLDGFAAAERRTGIKALGVYRLHAAGLAAVLAGFFYFQAAFFVFGVLTLYFAAQKFRIPAAAPPVSPRAAVRALFLFFLSAVLLLACGVFMEVTLNQKENGVPLFFLAAGIIHASLMILIRSLEGPGNEYLKRVSVFTALIFISTAVYDGAAFNRKVNDTRMVHDNQYNFWTTPRAAKDMPEALRPMVWLLPSFYHSFSPAAVKEAAAFLREKEGNFYLLGDMSILYGLAGKISTSPSLWFQPGLTIPKKEAPEYEIYQESIIRNLEKYDAAYIVIEGTRTFLGASADEFPLLQKYMEDHYSLAKEIGPFKFYERR